MAKEVSTLDALESEIVFDADTVQVDGEGINRAMNHAIANAETVDDILSANVTAVEKLKALWDANVEWIRNPFTVLEVSFNESSEEYADGGWGFYAVMQIADNEGVVHTLSTGSKTIVLKLYQIQKKSTFPMTVKVRFTASRTKGGYNAFDMVKA
jgi:RNAse (barnase) inhibitor barstar